MFKDGDTVEYVGDKYTQSFGFKFTIGGIYQVYKNSNAPAWCVTSDDGGQFYLEMHMNLGCKDFQLVPDRMVGLSEILAASTPNNKVCYHEWYTYTGLREQFECCKLCGIKKSDLKDKEEDDKYEPGSFGFQSATYSQSLPVTTTKLQFNVGDDVILSASWGTATIVAVDHHLFIYHVKFRSDGRIYKVRESEIIGRV